MEGAGSSNPSCLFSVGQMRLALLLGSSSSQKDVHGLINFIKLPKERILNSGFWLHSPPVTGPGTHEGGVSGAAAWVRQTPELGAEMMGLFYAESN